MFPKYIDQAFPEERDDLKEKAVSLLDVTATMVVGLFGDDEQNCSKFADALANYFKKSLEQGSSADAVESNSENESSDAAPVLLPKIANQPNAFCGYLRVTGKSKYLKVLLPLI